MSKISVIIPIYNVELYLKKCLDSIVHQTYKDLEIICVNDGSTDNSLLIINEYAKADSRIKIVNKNNGGLSSARNAGLKVATSEWISFVDSDDWLDIDTFEKLEKYFHHNSDIICFGTHLRGDVSSKLAKSDAEYYRIKHEGFITLTDDIRLSTDVATWNKLYKKSIIDNYKLTFPIGKHYEDYPFYWEYMFESKNAYYTKEKFYNYLRRPNSIMANTFNKTSTKVIDHLYASELIYNYLKERNLLKLHMKTFADIFVNCFGFAYIHSNKKYKTNVLMKATELLKKIDLENDFNDSNDIIRCLINSEYEKIPGVDYDKSILQKIFSIRKQGNDKIIKILGIKIKKTNKVKVLTSKIEKLEINQQILTTKIDELKEKLNVFETRGFSYWYNDNYVSCDNLYQTFITQRDPNIVYQKCIEYLSIKSTEDMSNFELLICILTLLEQNKNEDARSLLNSYITTRGMEDIWRFLPVAKFAKKEGYTSENIEKACIVFDKFTANNNAEILKRLIEGKSVAIVGNGPSEIGKDKGKEIDSHDIVIRFNNYKIEGFENDYGTKTDIWVKCSSDDIKHNLRDDKISLIVYEPDYMHHPIIDGYLDELYLQKIPISYYDFQDHFILRDKLNIFPTTGLVTIEKVLSFETNKIDIYGFSFLQEKSEKCSVHYFKDRSKEETIKRSSHHNYHVETDYLKKVIKIEEKN